MPGIILPIDVQARGLDAVAAQFKKLSTATQGIGKIASISAQYVGFTAVLRKVSGAIKNAVSGITELDKTITNIAVVTNMSQEDLWAKIPQYTKMAQQFGVAVNDVYTVSQLFYQQGLQTSQVMSMTNETLKMAKIAGMGYAEAADAMTVAVRAFNIEMSNSQRVTDVYSALAAGFAVSSQELATGMGKFASAAANAGMSVESASAFMTTMIQATRESANTVGTSLNAMIARFGKLKISPSEIIKDDEDGTVTSLNETDKALKSVGISLRDASGQFRAFDDVIMELSGKWGTLDGNTKKYIATLMAGARNQSRFFALVGNTSELQRAMQTANESENASLQQVLTTMNSIETKQQQMKNAMQALFTDLGWEESIKNFYDYFTQVFVNIKSQGVETIAALAAQITSLGTSLKGLSGAFNVKASYNAETGKYKNQYGGEISKEALKRGIGLSVIGTALDVAGAAITAAALDNIDSASEEIEQEWSKLHNALGQGVTAIGSAATAFGAFATGNVGLGLASTVQAITSGIAAIKNLFDGLDYTAAERYANSLREVEEAQNAYTTARANTSDLNSQINKIKELEKTAYTSAESLADYKAAMVNLADKYPELISYYDEAGNAVIDLESAEENLLKLRQKQADAAINLSNAEIRRQENLIDSLYGATGGSQMSKAVASGLGRRYYNEIQGWNGFAYTGTAIKVIDNNGGLLDIVGTRHTTAEETKNTLERLGYNSDVIATNQDGSISITVTSKDEADRIGGIADPSLRQYGNYEDFFKKWDENNKALIDAGIIESAERYFGTSYSNMSKWTDDEALKNIQTYQEMIQQKIDFYTEDIVNYYASLADGIGTSSLVNWYTTNSAKSDVDAIIANSSIVSNWISDGMESAKGGFETLADWARSKDADISFEAKAEELAKTYADMLANMFSDKNALEEFLSDAGRLTNYKSIDDLFAENNIEIDKNSDLYKVLVQEWTTANLNARNRLFNQIWGQNIQTDNESGLITHLSPDYNKNLNSDFTETDAFGNLNAKLIEWFDKASENDELEQMLVTPYANLLATAIKETNDLFTSGYTHEATFRLNNLISILNDMAAFPSDVQTALYETIFNIDWTSRESIKNAIDSIESYNIDKKYQNEVNTLVTNLQQSLNGVVDNVITAYKMYGDAIANSVKTSSSRTTALKNGLTYEKALEEYNKFMASADGSTSYNFDDFYSYDTALGKFVYTQAGLAKWLEKDGEELTDLESSIKQATDTAQEVYQAIAAGSADYNKDDIKLLGEAGSKLLDEWQVDFEKAVEAGVKYKDNEGNFKEYELDSHSFLEFVKNKLAEYTAESEKTQAQVLAAQIEKNFELLNSIDWEKTIANGASGTDELMLKQLLKDLSEKEDDWLAKFAASSVQSRTQMYAELFNKAASGKGQRQITSKEKAKFGAIVKNTSSDFIGVIQEILAGQGTVLSETAISLLDILNIDGIEANEYGQLVIEEAESTVDAALAFLERIKHSLTLAQYIDQKRAIFESQSSLGERGIKGTLTGADIQMLGYGDNYRQYLVNTASGYKFTEATATNFYGELRANSPLQASAFAATMAGQSGYDDYFKTLGKIKELTKELTNASEEQQKSLLNQIALYSEMAGVIQATGKAMKFMSNALPAGLQNASDYFEDASKAVVTLKDALKSNSGEIGYTDFYNIVTHMIKGLKSADIDGAQEQIGKLNKLLILASNNTHIYNGQLSLSFKDIEKACKDGVIDLNATLDDVIKEMAKGQLKWIDAQIALVQGLTLLDGAQLPENGSYLEAIKRKFTEMGFDVEETDEAINNLIATIERTNLGAKIRELGIENTNVEKYLAQFFKYAQESKVNIEDVDLLSSDGIIQFSNSVYENLDFGEATKESEVETPPQDVEIKLNLKADKTSATFQIGDKTLTWTSDSGTSLDSFVQDAIQQYNEENGIQLSPTIKLNVDETVTAEGDTTVTGHLIYTPAAKNSISFKFNNTDNLDQAGITAAIGSWATTFGLSSGAIEVNLAPLTITNANGDNVATISLKAQYNAGEVTYTSGDIETVGDQLNISDIENWAASKGIDLTGVNLKEKFNTEIKGIGKVSLSIDYKLTQNSLANQIQRKFIISSIRKTLVKAGVTANDIVKGTNLAYHDGVIDIESVIATASSESTITCKTTIDCDADTEEKIAENKTKVNDWRKAINSAQAILTQINATDMPTPAGDGTKNFIQTVTLKAGLNIVVEDKGITVEGEGYKSSYNSIDDFFADYQSKYQLQLNGQFSANARPSYNDWYTEKDVNNNLNPLDYYLRDNVDQQQLIGLFENSSNDNEFYKSVIDLLTASNKLDKEQLKAYEDGEDYKWDDLFENWEALINPTSINSTAKDGGFTSDTTDNEKVEAEIAQVLQQFASIINKLNTERDNKSAQYEELTAKRDIAINTGNNALAAKYQNKIANLANDIIRLNGTIENLTTIQDTVTALQNSGKSAEEVAIALDGAVAAVNKVQGNLDKTGNNITSSSVTSAISSLAQAIRDKISEINKIKAGEGTGDGSSGGDTGGGTPPAAKGNVALAKGTLMGELGPEMVVANGRYFIAGQNGAEFVDLPDDAIVFNHLQTASLMANGHSTRGKAVRSDAAAVAMASGNWNGGPAKASNKTEDTLTSLQSLRGVWLSLLGTGAADLGKKGGSGAGGAATKAILHDLERWYNLLRQIEKITKQISLEEKQRENMREGTGYTDSLQLQLSLLQKQQAAYKKLADAQERFYNARREDQENSQYSMFFTYDEDGLMQYNEGNFHILEELQATDENGKAKLSAEEQLKLLKAYGFDTSVLEYGPDGEQAKDDAARVSNFYDAFDGWVEELDSVYDSYHDYLEQIEDNLTSQNKILQEFRTIQINTEQLIVQAIEDRERAVVEELQKEYDLLQDTSSKYLDGLNKSLSQERDMYDKNKNTQQLNQLQRQLAILQRSGGSAAAIRSIEEQINNQLQDQYFTEREDEIKAIQDASDKQLEKMQTQINIMSETLEYQKENGLWWPEVYDKMENWDANSINAFVTEMTKEFNGMSAIQAQEKMSENLKLIEEWLRYNATNQQFEKFLNTVDEKAYGINDDNRDARIAGAKTAYNRAFKDSGSQSEAEKAAIEWLTTAYTSAQKVETDSQKKPDESIIGSKPSSGSSSGSGANGDYYWYKTADGQTRYALKAWAEANSAPNYGIIKYGTTTGVPTDEDLKKIKQQNAQGIYQFSEGGLVNYTGLAMVHGTQSNPEAFISAADRQLMKSSIFSKTSYDIFHAFEQFEKFAKVLATNYSDNATNNNGVTIENLSLNLDSNLIADDYDARRAAQVVMDEIVKVARQSTNLSLNRR